LVDVALGTDTAGSGRVPAAFNEIIGVKPTLGLVPVDGVVPTCTSFDAVTVMGADLATQVRALGIMSGPSPADPRSRPWPTDVRLAAPDKPVVALPLPENLVDLSADGRARFDAVAANVVEIGGQLRRIDISEFLEAARLLYEGGLVAERYASFGAFVEAHPDGTDPSVASIISAAAAVPCWRYLKDQERLRALRQRCLARLDGCDALITPTAPRHPTIEDITNDPIGVNSQLGVYTNFVNLFGMAAVAIPAGEADGGAFGVSILTRPFEDQVALDLAARLTGQDHSPLLPEGVGLSLIVFGAHMRDQPLNAELWRVGARPIGKAVTSAEYRMFALEGVPPRPLVVPAADGGRALTGEEWLVSPAGLGRLTAGLPFPMALGAIALADGRWSVGFTAQTTAGATDITSFAGWRAYLASRGA
jgi:allophanate hydrolase